MNTRWAYRTAILLSALTICAPAAAQQFTPHFADFGPELAPPLPPAAARAALPAEGQVADIVVHAGGGLVLMVPQGWHVSEVPWVREERLVLTPEPLAGPRRMPRDGVWLTYHYRPENNRPENDQEPALADIVGPRLSLATSSKAQPLGAPVPEQVDGWPASRQSFRLASESEGAEEEPTLGQHMLIRTPWGIVEIHVRYPESLASDRERQVPPMVGGLKLAAPQLPAGPIAPSVAAATDVLGAWKAYAARMEFRRDGRVIMYFDNRTLRPIDEQPAARVHITGHFTAEDDLLHVTWDDGSQQNFRWRRAELDLVLTDHTGQVSALRKLFQ